MFEMRPYRRNSMSAWNPFSEMEEMERRLFNNDFFSGRGLAEFKTDITDEGDYYELKADLPGFKKEDIQLQLDGDTLTIQAQRHSEHEEQEKKGKYVCCERSYGAYSPELRRLRHPGGGYYRLLRQRCADTEAAQEDSGGFLQPADQH